MKKLHKLLLGTFLGPFLATLFITNFLLLMIWFWKYLEDIIGKGLDFLVVLELIGYASLNQIPMSLPLAMLLSSIMTFGKLGETVELTALRSLGVSMWRTMQPLILVAALFSVGAYYVNDNVLPVTNTKLKNLLRDITAKKPELSIPEGVFYKGLDGYTIRVGKKNPDKSLKNLIIFENKSNSDRFITADSGRLELSTDGEDLVLVLFNGTAYEYQQEDYKKSKYRRFPMIRNDFVQNQLVFSLNSFSFERTESNFDYDARLKNNAKIIQYADSLSENISLRKQRLVKELQRNFYLRPDTTFCNDTLNYQNLALYATMDSLSAGDKVKIYRHAADIAHNAQQTIYSAKVEVFNDDKFMVRHLIEYHKKIAFSVACLILFFVGAPFGAIVKKGGLGMPVVISAGVFVVYHVLSMIGEKLAKNGDWEVYKAVWMATVVMFPLGLFLMLRVILGNVLSFKNLWSKFKRTN